MSTGDYALRFRNTALDKSFDRRSGSVVSATGYKSQVPDFLAPLGDEIDSSTPADSWERPPPAWAGWRASSSAVVGTRRSRRRPEGLVRLKRGHRGRRGHLWTDLEEALEAVTGGVAELGLGSVSYVTVDALPPRMLSPMTTNPPGNRRHTRIRHRRRSGCGPGSQGHFLCPHGSPEHDRDMLRSDPRRAAQDRRVAPPRGGSE